MPCHEFVIYNKKPNYFTNFTRIYLKAKDIVKISDDIINSISFTNVETYFNYYQKKYKQYDLNLFGITIIPPTSLEQFLKIIKSHNKSNKVMNDLIELTEEAIEGNNYIIHYGI